MSLTFAQLATKYAGGLTDLDLRDFEDVTPTDRLRLLEDITGSDVVRLATSDGEEVHVRAKKGKEALPPRTFRYTMSTGEPVGPFGDVVVVKGWDLRDFNKRGRPFLFGHNSRENRHPLGSMSRLSKNDPTDRVGGKDVLAGNASFTPEGLNPFNDLTHDMVAAGAMRCGSVGFHILKHRLPTEEELAADSRLKKCSFIAEKAGLVEFSAVPVGMDPDAVKRRSSAGTPFEARLAEHLESGRFDPDLIAEFRHAYIGEPAPRGREQVTGIEFERGASDESEGDEALEEVLGLGEENPETGEGRREDSAGDGAGSEPVSTPTLDEVIRGLDSLGLIVERDELEEAIRRSAEPESDSERDLRAEIARLSEANTQLEERLSRLEAGSEPGEPSREPVSEDGEERDIYDLLFEANDEELAALVAE